ncbi:aminomethyltransferase, mitochondrial-like isoform X1 [Biomphalaria glabrata]|uniref:Aminomethyltransferase n=2 Tax=Biomphalaria glabrata TaxID=6526 RepID=A0A9U8EN40_BIOGL|nr:aminomethyltransferase, mitochondrial-like isoform X1 [Biomphalaria glabrata]KAI8726312.1 aminomethyltransferase, mitochondrial [Biomphalaria glabrata]
MMVGIIGKYRPFCFHHLYKTIKSNRFSSKAGELKRTCLYDFHVAEGAKIVPFAGWEMPVQYKSGIIKEHLHVRKEVGIFDVSHMLQTRVDGKDRKKFMESLVVLDVEDLKPNQGSLTVFTNEKGGIIDDLIVSNTSEGYLYVVSNAGCADKDMAHMKAKEAEFQKNGLDVKLTTIETALLAVQGPSMKKVLQPGLDFDLNSLPFMTTISAKVFGAEGCRVTRCGYTGEDGVEISIPSNCAVDVLSSLMSSPKAPVQLIGLGARDSLRLEAGLCLYGNDIDETTTPVEANLTWLVSKGRRAKADFPGAEIILQQIKSKPTKRRVGFTSTGIPVRGHAKIYSQDGKELIGEVTSGCPSPSLNINVSMGYVKTAYAKNGTKVKIEVRQKMIDADVTKLPFVPSNYFIPS